MADLFLKEHGANASGVLSKEPDGRWRTSLIVSIPEQGEQTRGPEFFGSDRAAREWIAREASKHGFADADIDIHVEDGN